MDISIYAWGREVIEGIRKIWSDIGVIPFAFSKPSWQHFIPQQIFLGRKTGKVKPSVVPIKNYLPLTCRTPQLFHHQNLYMYIPEECRKIANLIMSGRIRRIMTRVSLIRFNAGVFISDHMRNPAEKIRPKS